MYSDRVESETGISKTLKNRLNGGSGDFSTRGRHITRNRERQNSDKWEHDLFDDDNPRISNRRVDPKDLRLKLQNKHQSGRDLREKLSGTMKSQLRISNPPKFKREATKPTIKNVVASNQTKLESRTSLNKAATKKNSQQVNESVDSFLESMGLEKYSTAFQVEEVDMDALMHMTDDDLKALLIPMGPRKKILLALGSKR